MVIGFGYFAYLGYGAWGALLTLIHDLKSSNIKKKIPAYESQYPGENQVPGAEFFLQGEIAEMEEWKK